MYKVAETRRLVFPDPIWASVNGELLTPIAAVSVAAESRVAEVMTEAGCVMLPCELVEVGAELHDTNPNPVVPVENEPRRKDLTFWDSVVFSGTQGSSSMFFES